MSDMSALATQYNQLMAITDKVNDSVKVIIKDELAQDNPEMRQRANFNVAPERLNQAKETLSGLVRTLLSLVTSEPTTDSLLDLPNIIAEDYQKRLQNEPLQGEFKGLLNAIGENKPIGKTYQRLLEEIITTLDSDRRQFYRKLRARR